MAACVKALGAAIPAGETIFVRGVISMAVLALMGLFGVLGQLSLTWSYRFAEASTIAPLDYASLLMAVGYGYCLFDEVPRASTWVGAPLVIAAGLVIFWREYRRALPRAAN